MSGEKAHIDQVLFELESLRKILEDFPRGEAQKIVTMAETISRALEAGNTIFTCGNGGSAADAQHIAGELVGRFRRRKKKGYRAVALTVNPSVVTAMANDYTYDEVFSRQIESMGTEGDVLLVLSTSGNSPNVIEAVREADALKMTSLAFSGGEGGRLAKMAAVTFVVRHDDFARIQEIHMTAGHILCGLVESMLSGRS